MDWSVYPPETYLSCCFNWLCRLPIQRVGRGSKNTYGALPLLSHSPSPSPGEPLRRRKDWWQENYEPTAKHSTRSGTVFRWEYDKLQSPSMHFVGCSLTRESLLSLIISTTWGNYVFLLGGRVMWWSGSTVGLIVLYAILRSFNWPSVTLSSCRILLLRIVFN